MNKKSCKSLLLVLNLLFLAGGLTFLAVGIWIVVDYQSFSNVFSNSTLLFQYAAYAMIVVGGIISLIAFLGCYGAYSENKAFLGVFFIVLVVIVLLEIAMLVVAFEFYVDIAIYIAPTAVNSIKELYGQSSVTASAATASWNTLQATLDCCGFYNGSDYNSSLFDVMMNTNVQPWPESCCILASGSQQFVNLTSCTNTEPPNTQHTNAKTGCVVALYRILRNYCGVIGGVSAAILVVEIFAMIPACWMFRKSDTYV